MGGFAIGAWDALLWQHYGNAWQSPAVIRQAQRTPHALRTHAPAINRRACCVCNVICNEAVPFRPYCTGVATRTRNVSEYMRVLAICLVLIVKSFATELAHRYTGRLVGWSLTSIFSTNTAISETTTVTDVRTYYVRYTYGHLTAFNI